MDWNGFLPYIRHLPAGDQAIIRKAYDVGEKAHAGQKRQSGEPYFTHPVAVAEILTKMGADRDTIVAALLHDTVEDTPLTLEDIDRDFGPDVMHLIDGATKLTETDFEKHPTLDERIETLRKMFNLMQVDVRIMIIKLADRLHNMQTISFRPKEKQAAVARETQDVYVKIADRLCMRAMRDDLERLCMGVLEPELLPALEAMRAHDKEIARDVSDMLRTKVCEAQGAGSCVIEHEDKSWDSLRKQYEQERKGFGRNVLNFVFVCDDVGACYSVLGKLHQRWQRETHTFEDYVNAPLINGYQALHTTVILEDGTRARCKIRTKEMHAYDQKGISLYCFDQESLGVLHYLPWTRRITPLSAATQDRSIDYWESLRSDILGESNVIHGDTDKTQSLPKGATALDGIFYFYGDRGLNAVSVAVNGKAVPFYEELKYGDSLIATFDALPQVSLKWLQYIRTGIGGAFVRQGLGRQDIEVRRTMGQNLLQEYLNFKRRGFISEFDREELEKLLAAKGMPSLTGVYEQIAEGRITPQEVEQALFLPEAGEKEDAQAVYRLSCTIPLANRTAFFDTLKYHMIRNVRLTRASDASRSYKAKLQMTAKEAEMLSFALENLSGGFPYALRKISSFYKAGVASVVLVVLWGLDPTIGRILMRHPTITPVDMTIIRFLTLTVISGALFLWTNRKKPLREVRISWKNPSLWLSSVFLFLVSVTTYWSLQDTSPMQYTIPMTCAGLFMTSIVNRANRRMLALMWTLVAVSLFFLAYFARSWTPASMGMTLLAVAAFTGFSFVSERYKRVEQVSQRISQYFLTLSTLCTLLSALLFPFSTLTDITPDLLVSIVTFSIVCTGVPYYIYYYLLSHKEIDFVLRYSFLIIPATLASQFVFIGNARWYTYVAGIIMVAAAAVPLLTNRASSTETIPSGK